PARRHCATTSTNPRSCPLHVTLDPPPRSLDVMSAPAQPYPPLSGSLTQIGADQLPPWGGRPLVKLRTHFTRMCAAPAVGLPRPARVGPTGQEGWRSVPSTYSA